MDETREKRLTLARYFNNRLMNADDRFAKDTNYIFYSQYMSELNQVIEKTQISIRKTVTKFQGGKINSDMIRNPEILSRLLKNDEAIRFMQPIRGTPAYWSATLKNFFAMLRQLGIPTWFCSFSSAEYGMMRLVLCLDNEMMTKIQMNLIGRIKMKYCVVTLLLWLECSSTDFTFFREM